MSEISKKPSSCDENISTSGEPPPSHRSEVQKSAALNAIVSFLEELRLPEIASAIRTKTVTSPEIQLSETATRRLIDSLIRTTDNIPCNPVTQRWSQDDAEKSAVPVLKNILESDQYISRNQIKEFTRQLASTASPFSTSPWKSGYPRYRAPLTRPSTRLLDQLPPSPQRRESGRSPTSQWGCLVDVNRSEEYTPKSPGPRENDKFDPTDQYRDDDDPGYRIRDLWETDLIDEIQARERQNSEALGNSYCAAFVCSPTSITRKQNNQSGPAGSHLGFAPIIATSSRPTPPSSPSSSSIQDGRITAPTSSAIESRLLHHQSGTPPRKSSISSHSSNSRYVLNSTPPRSRGQGSTNGSPLSKGFEAAGASPSLCSDGSQRCSSPTFGLPTTAVDYDDELSGAALATPTDAYGTAPASSDTQKSSSSVLLGLECCILPPDDDGTSSGNDSSTAPQTNLLQCVPQLMSPKSPVFGVEEVDDFKISGPTDKAVDFCGMEDEGREKTELRHSQDELSLCSSKKPEVGDIPPAGSVLDSNEEEEEEAVDALADARRWRAEYCDGNSQLHRQRKARSKMSSISSVLYPESGDPEFPIIDENKKVIDCFSLKVVFERNKTGFEEYKDFQVKLGSVIAGRYVVESQLGQAAFSKALRCYDMKSKQHVCMKVIRNEKDYVDQSLDEIKLLRYINCNGDVDMVYCLRLLDFFYYMEHLIIVTEILKENLYEFSRKYREQKGANYFTMGRVQRVAAQVLVALEYIHSLRLIHSDLKPENILMQDAETCQIKVIDFGSSCFEDDLLSVYVQSRSYRAPEVLLGLPYDQKIDLWSLGCILAELWTGYVLLQNDSAAALLARIVGIIGQIPYYMVCKGQTVSEHFTQDGQLFRVKTEEPVCPRGGKRIRILLPKPSSLKQRMRTHDTVFIDFLTKLLQIDPSKRPTAAEALEHPWLQPGRYSDGLQSSIPESSRVVSKSQCPSSQHFSFS